MRELTFKGFLAKYVKELSLANTVDLTVLAKEAVSVNYRLRAPLLLYAVMHRKTATLRTQLTANACPEEVLDMLSTLEVSPVEAMLDAGSLPEEYCKVWNSFKAKHDKPKHDEELKAAMRMKILQLQKTKNCSTYKLYKELKLNPGNINSWLKNGDGTKVSYRTAERIISYVIQY